MRRVSAGLVLRAGRRRPPAAGRGLYCQFGAADAVARWTLGFGICSLLQLGTVPFGHAAVGGLLATLGSSLLVCRCCNATRNIDPLAPLSKPGHGGIYCDYRDLCFNCHSSEC